jgi:hypothetical protein
MKMKKLTMVLLMKRMIIYKENTISSKGLKHLGFQLIFNIIIMK